MKRNYRNTWRYEFLMWWYSITFEDVKRWVKNIAAFIYYFIITIIFFGMLFFLPAFFH